MRVLYVRVSDSAHAYVTQMSARSGLSMAVITSLIIDEARTRGWQITTGGARITDTGDSLAAASPSLPTPRDQGQPPTASPPQGGGAGP